ncbi:ABC transporter ATP-binding protein [Gloeobacter morelensis]|uniref:ABC transporter ATP-binding protein n=1 Tax=Gloeobacter morelensis MG652769 TaxID=2781736 RepID=A0ABY3PJQ4_9CYAN|nr:ABC transporter ATP-binding protein [Gloeobacter morelensis]UFP93900.1 ABC transporter ATP-binding protein [Gloeobacter morelensis MG652769]
MTLEQVPAPEGIQWDGQTLPPRPSGFWKLLAMLKSHFWLMGLTIASGITNQAMAIAATCLGAYLVGTAVTGSNVEALVPLLWLLGGTVLLRALMAWLEMWLAHDLAYRILADVRGALYRALERLAPSYLLDRRSGDLACSVMSDVEMLEWFYAHTVGTFVVAVVVPVGALIALATLHGLLVLSLLPALVLVVSIPLWFGRRASREGKALRRQLGEVNAEVVDAVQGLREIVAFGQGGYFGERLARRDRELRKSQMAHGGRAGLEGALTNGAVSLGMLCVLAAAAYLVARGSLGFAFFPLSIVLAAYTFEPVVALTRITQNLGVIFAAAERVFAVLDAPALVEDKVAAPPTGQIVPHVRFNQVSFRYGPALPNALENVSFEVAAGETVALVGHSGAGKSTCIHLLLRFWDTTAGSVTIGGHDLRNFPQATLRELIALVPQDIYLFNMSIRDNIRLGRPAACDEEVKAAARLALADEFVCCLPQGYDTNAGERGLQLSGGQRQRIAIARALLKNSPILVMDEAVSNLDTENELALQTAMDRLRSGRTTLVIAHRLSTIRSADRIVVLQAGQVVETGTHAQLMRRGGRYAELLAAQHN